MASSSVQNFEYKAKEETVELTSLWTIWGPNPYSSDCSPVVSESLTIVSTQFPGPVVLSREGHICSTLEKQDLHL